MTNREYLTEYVKTFVSTVTGLGIREAVISPGSRSTPLAYACMQAEELTVYRQIDERSAAYFALGLAKASGRPVMLLCTSGTAAANYFPAVVEAFYARVPLLVVTADRPHELREVGAPQAINQIGLFGRHAKWTTDLPLAEPENRLDFLSRHLHRAIGTAINEPKGPVHVNVPFREPLMIDFEQEVPAEPTIRLFPAHLGLDPSAAAFLTELFEEERGLLILGEQLQPMPEAFWQFIRKLKWPVLADPLSNVRANVPASCKDLIIDSYDALLKSEVFKDGVKPDAVLRIGPQPVSKPLTLYLAALKPKRYAVVDESAMLRDAQSIATHHIQAGSDAVWQLPIPERQESPYLKRWQQASSLYWKTVGEHTAAELDEGVYAEALFRELDGADLIVGSSMPIRDADTFFRTTEKDVCMYANRGTNGIDGVVSTAFGIQAARRRPAVLFIGDLSFLHDLNGLIASRLQQTDLTIVVMNNDGGGIFSYLPQGREERHYEDLFGTPTGLTFRDAASMYGAEYAEIRTKEAFIEELRKEKEAPVKIIEVFTDRSHNTETHRKLWTAVSERLEAEWN